jgi:hypothetical protein
VTARRERGPGAANTLSVDALASPGRRRLLVAGTALGTLAAGCGGGHELAGVGSGGTGQVAFSSGPISGFGSVIVNGVKFDDSAASVADDLGQARKLSELGLGMFVEIVGTIDQAAGLGKALSIRIVSQVIGRVDAIDLAARRFTVLTVPIAYNDATVWNTDAEDAALVLGGRVEVWGFLDSANGMLRASRVEVNVVRTAVSAKLRGPVSEYDRQAAWLRIDQQFVDLQAVPGPLPATIEAGSIVQATGTQLSAAGAPLRATTLSIEPAVLAPSIEEVTLDATIASWSGLARFRVEGFSIDGSAAAIFGGDVSTLAEGVRIRVTGSVRGNAVSARSIDIRSLLVATVDAPPTTAPTADDPPPTTAPTADNPPPTAAPTADNPPPTTAPTADNPPPTTAPTADNPPPTTAPTADNPPPTTAPTADNPPPTTAPTADNPPLFASTPLRGSPYVEDTVQVTGVIIKRERLAEIKVRDASGRRFTVDARDTKVRNGNKGDLDPGQAILVTGMRGTVIKASTIQLL